MRHSFTVSTHVHYSYILCLRLLVFHLRLELLALVNEPLGTLLQALHGIRKVTLQLLDDYLGLRELLLNNL